MHRSKPAYFVLAAALAASVTLTACDRASDTPTPQTSTDSAPLKGGPSGGTSGMGPTTGTAGDRGAPRPNAAGASSDGGTITSDTTPK